MFSLQREDRKFGCRNTHFDIYAHKREWDAAGFDRSDSSLR